MVERQDDPTLTETLKAASDPTRRAILTFLAQEGPMRVTDIAARFDMSLNAVSKHIKVLEAARLVRRRKDWREHMIEIDLGPLQAVDRWFAGLKSIWALRLDALDQVLRSEDTDDRDPEP